MVTSYASRPATRATQPQQQDDPRSGGLKIVTTRSGNSPLLPRYVPGLDGLRALAVLGVLAYHFGLTVAGHPIRGGLLGVDVFFVLSGFLITSLLLDEHARTGAINLRRFWARRARRLLPALLLLLVGIACYSAYLADPADHGRLRGDGLSALFYTANWHFAFTGQDYFSSLGTASPLLHTWSLAVEEQFYLLWPLLVLIVLFKARRSRARVAILALIGSAVSVGLTALLAARGASFSRLYFGTDTRAAALLVGAALAAASPAIAAKRYGAAGRRLRRLLTSAGTVGLLVLLSAMWSLNGEEPALYRGGFAIVAVCSALLVAALVGAPGSFLTRAFSILPLRLLGRISYGIYLWHWPVEIVLTGTRTGASGYALFGIRCAATLGLSIASYLVVEQPIRRTRLVRWPRRVPAVLTGLTSVGVLCGLLVTTVTPATVTTTAASVTSGILHRSEGRVRSAPLPAKAPPLPTAKPLGGALSLAAKVPLDHPLRVVLTGDSLATTLGLSLSSELAPNNTQLWLDAPFGCGLLAGAHYDRGKLLPDPATCAGWQQRWAGEVATNRADVLTVLVGRWEATDRFVSGRFRHLGDPVFDAYVRRSLEQVVTAGAAQGAQVVFLTVPCLQDPEMAGGGRYPQDDPARLARMNQLIREVAARHQTQVTVLDLAGFICPGGSYQEYIDGVQVRDRDGVHFTLAGGLFVGRVLLPALREVAEEAAADKLRPVTANQSSPAELPQ